MRIIVACLLLSGVVPVVFSASQQRGDDVGVSGYVVAPDGAPVASGVVVVTANPNQRVTTSVDRSGFFRFVPVQPGVHRVYLSVPGLEPHRFDLTVPASRSIKLPAITLSPPTYVRVRVVSNAGEPIPSARVRRDTFDGQLAAIPEWPEAAVPVVTEVDGTMTIGPLPRGVNVMTVESYPWAPVRLQDVTVTGDGTVVDAGVVALQTGATLHVEVVDATGAAVRAHDVGLEDTAPRSPFIFRGRTNDDGRAVFDRLPAGRYRLRTIAAGGCDNRAMSVSRLVTVAGNGNLLTRLVVGGTARLRVSTQLGAMSGVLVSASSNPEPAPPPVMLGTLATQMQPGPLAAFAYQPECGAWTDSEGRAVFTVFPPGLARVAVRHHNSRYVRLVTFAGEQETAITVPDGLMPLRITNAVTKQAVAAAIILWAGRGDSVEAVTTANGEALLEGIAPAPGRLSISAAGYERYDESIAEPMPVLREVSLRPAPLPGLNIRVVTSAREPVSGAVVEVRSANPLETRHITVTGANGDAAFASTPTGQLQVMVTADGFAPATLLVTAETRSAAAAMIVTLQCKTTPCDGGL